MQKKISLCPPTLPRRGTAPLTGIGEREGNPYGKGRKPIQFKNKKCRYLVFQKEQIKLALLIRPVFLSYIPNSFFSKLSIMKIHQNFFNIYNTKEARNDYHSNLLNKQFLTIDFLSYSSFDFQISKISPVFQKKPSWFFDSVQKHTKISKKNSFKSFFMKFLLKDGLKSKGNYFLSNKQVYYTYKPFFYYTFQLKNSLHFASKIGSVNNRTHKNFYFHFSTSKIQTKIHIYNKNILSNSNKFKKHFFHLCSIPYFQWFLMKETNEKIFNQNKNFHSKNSFLFYKFRIVIKNNIFATTDIFSQINGELLEQVENSWWKTRNDFFFMTKKLYNTEIFLTKRDMFSIFLPKLDYCLGKNHSILPCFYPPLRGPLPVVPLPPVGVWRRGGDETQLYSSKKWQFYSKKKILEFSQTDQLFCKIIDPVLNIESPSQKQKSFQLKKLFLFYTIFYSAKYSGQNPEDDFRTRLLPPGSSRGIQNFSTKYQNRFYKLKGLVIGKLSNIVQLRLGKFLFKENFLNPITSFQKTGQIIHFNFKKITFRHAQSFLVSPKGILHVNQGDPIFKNAPILTLPFDTFTTGDIVQGIPKVEQYLEARTTLSNRPFLYSLPILLQGIFQRYCTKFPLEQAVPQSFLKIQLIIVDGVQRVYRSQGVSIADKHLEVIVKQMTSKVQIIHGGQTGFFPGELVDLEIIQNIHSFLMIKIRYEPVILGITRASLEAESFLSAASFQQTTKILAKASLYKKKDFLKGLKENIFIGNLIPAGTGYIQ